MKTALLIIDVQNDYFDGGAMPLVGMDTAADNCGRLLDAFRIEALPVFHVQHLSMQPGATFFLPDTPGCEISQRVAPRDGETLVVKHFPSAFRQTSLEAGLKQADITHLVICGAMSHMCIDTTTRAAFDLAYTCTLVSDACATRELTFEGRTVSAADVHAAYMAALGTVFARVVKTEACLEGLSAAPR